MRIIDKYSKYLYDFNMLNIKSAIELFHLLFLQVLASKIDKSLVTLKGGCNLRFYFQSIRYSEDLDLDLQIIQGETLKNKVNKILSGHELKQLLTIYELELNNPRLVKLNDTTARWKGNIVFQSNSVPTKIEFSKRDSFCQQTALLEPMDLKLQIKYKLKPVLFNHYNLSSALKQKILALAGRKETQARDIFDLSLLIDQSNSKFAIEENLRIKQSQENLLLVDYKQYYSQVVAYLEDEYQEFYGQKAYWEQIQEKVFTFLEHL